MEAILDMREYRFFRFFLLELMPQILKTSSLVRWQHIKQAASGFSLLVYLLTPTRSAIHTDRLPIRFGTQKVPAPGEPQGMAPWEYTTDELLSDAGYATAMYGKWHIGDKDGRLQNDQSYNE